MFILGINSAFHDSSACILDEDRIIAAAEEERFTGIKHGKRPIPFSAYELPFNAIHYCLKEADIHLRDVDHIAYSFLPDVFPGHFDTKRFITLPFNSDIPFSMKKSGMSVWDPLFYLFMKKAPNFLIDNYPHHLQDRLSGLTKRKMPKWHFVDHHLSHAASCFYPSVFKESAILIIDGRGESATTTYGYGDDNRNINVISQVHMPHSLGILYEKVTEYLGFLHSSDEYKVMALASYGKPKYKKIFQDMIQFKENGQYSIYYQNFEKLFGPKRVCHENFETRHFDIAKSLQEVLEESVLKIAKWLKKKTQSNNLSMAGGVALNCVMNGRLKKEGIFKNIWIQPAAGDAGTALGAALFVEAKLNISNRKRKIMEHVYYGPSFCDSEIKNVLNWSKISYEIPENLSAFTADRLKKNKIIGWFQGRMEFGPRALGNRSIIASPLDSEMQNRLNDIKDREDFRPVAPVIMEEHINSWFKNAERSPFMLFVYDVRENKKKYIPAVTHIDGTARIQTIKENENQLYYHTISEFYKLTGIPILINTSFNSRGKPIVCSPRDALDCFYTTPIDDLIIGSFFITKEKN